MPDIMRVDPAAEQEQVTRLTAFKQNRDQQLVRRPAPAGPSIPPAQPTTCSRPQARAQRPLHPRRGLRSHAEHLRQLPTHHLTPGMSTMANRRIRVVVAKPGLDGHDRARRSSLARCGTQAWR